MDSMQRGRAVFAGVMLAVLSPGAAQAFEFDLAGTPVRIDSLLTVGGVMRMQNRDVSLIGKPNVTPGLCLRRTSGAPDEGARPHPDYANDPGGTTNSYTTGKIQAVCATSDNPEAALGIERAIVRFNNSPGSFSPNGDNGNLNFDKHDLVQATAKITSDINTNLFGFNIFARGLYFFDQRYNKLQETHPDNTLAARHNAFSAEGRHEIGTRARLLDYFVSRVFTDGEREYSIKVGNQVLNWGESGFLVANSLNSINPPNQALLRIPGFDIKELFQPVGMVVGSATLFQGTSLEAFYQYDWKPVVIDPPGSFFSTSDTLGAGGYLAMLSFSRAPEDYGYPINDPRYPAGRRGFYRAIDTCDPANVDPTADQNTPCVDSAGTLGSTSSRSIFRDKAEEKRREPKGGQYGIALKTFLDSINGGTEVGFYYANYHSRFPTISAFAALDTCITDAPSLFRPGAAGGCGVANVGGVPAVGTPAEREPLPVDTVRLVVEYPKDIHMFGLSFNTTVGDFALSGEYTFRDNLPMQVFSTDLIYAALQPAFPANDVSLGATTVPGRRAAVPDFVMTNYRKQTVTAGQYIRGYERMKQGQAGVTLLKTVGGGNVLGASQITLLMEAGHTYVFDFPKIDELQFQGAGVDTHLSAGADGSPGINPLDVRTNPADPSTNSKPITSHQNPTAHRDLKGVGSQQSYGYRLVTLTRFDDAVFGVNVELLNAFFHDVRGTGPGIGQNFIEGRRQALSGIRFDYLARYTGEIRYTWFFGGANRDPLRDRDNLLMTVGYQF